MDNKKPKRKTSSAVKNKYKAKTYSRLALEVHKDKAEAYKQACRDRGIPYNQPLIEAIDIFLAESKK